MKKNSLCMKCLLVLVLMGIPTLIFAQTTGTIVLNEHGGESIIPLSEPLPSIEIEASDLQEMDQQAAIIFEAFKNNDIEVIESYLPTYDEYKEILENTYVKNKKRRSQLAFDAKGDHLKVFNNSCESFSQVQENVTVFGNRVNKLEIVDIQHRLPRNPSHVAATVTIHSKEQNKDNDENFQFIIGSLFNYGGNWYLLGDLKWKKNNNNQ